MTYSADLRDRVVSYYRSSPLHTFSHVAQVFGVSASTVQRWVKGFVPVGHRVRKIERAKDCVASILREDPYATYLQMQALVLERLGLSLSFGSIHTVLKELGIRRKRVVERKIWGNLERVEALRQAFRASITSETFADSVSIDECHFTLNCAPRYGYAPKGQRLLHEIAPMSNVTYSLVMAISRREGVLHYELHRGSINTDRYHSFLSQMNLRHRAVLMDNVAFHRATRVRELLESRQCLAVYTAPYTPQYNPIELAFAQIKAHYRAASARVRRAMTEADIEAAIATVEAQHCAHYFDFVWNEINGQRPRLPDLRGSVRRYPLND